MDISLLGKGCLIKPLSLRDYRFELIAGADLLPAVFSLKDKIPTIKNQDGSSSCVAQATSYYLQLINYFETQGQTALSARDVYSSIFQPQGGASIIDAMKKVCDSGIVPEAEAPSYNQGNPPDEQFMRNRADITPQEQDDGMTYVAQKYLTWGNQNIDLYKQAIYQGHGCVVACGGNNYCWQNGLIITPDNQSQVAWSHAIFLIGWNDADQTFDFVNSWGNTWGFNGFGKLPYSYVQKGFVSNAFTLIDYPNTWYLKQMSIIKNLMEMINIVKKLIDLYKQKVALKI